MNLDRALQLEWLNRLAAAYPEQINIDGERVAGDPATINLWYLDEHGLVEALKSECLGAPPVVVSARITARGLDFLADDGGLSAMLGTVTVKLHADTLRELLEARVSRSDLPAEEKNRLIDHLHHLPAEALKTVTKRLVEAALDRLPDAIQLLQTLPGF